MSAEKGSSGGHSGGIDLTGALTRANVEGRSAGRSTPFTSEGDGDLQNGTPADDHTLHATDGRPCYACGAPLGSRDAVRITAKGTRHDSCP